jgi:hypothetical protein
MYNHNERIINNNNPSKIDNKFLDAIAEFIRSVESELDIMLYGGYNVVWLYIVTIPVTLQNDRPYNITETGEEYHHQVVTPTL